MTDTVTTPRPRCWIVLDIESAVIDDTAHKRYQSMERWVPSDDKPIRRGYQRSEDPLTTPRWIFQTVTTASMMVLIQDDQGGIDVSRFITLSAPDYDERSVLKGILQVLADAPDNAELCTWMGLAHDIPILVSGCMRHGLTLPKGWGWLAHGGYHKSRHLDLAHSYTAGMKMKPIHLAEVLAAMDIPSKITAPAFAIAQMIYAGRWDAVAEACEIDVFGTACLLARWQTLIDGRSPVEAVEDRILRRVIELRGGRSYIPALEAHRLSRFKASIALAANDAKALAPWLDEAA